MNNIKDFKIKALILDMDGVLWKGDKPIGDLPSIFKIIKFLGYKVILATNNAMLSVDQYLDKLSGFGVELESRQIINSAQATALYLKQEYPEGGPLYIIGEIGLRSALKNFDFFHSETEPIAVIAGLDRTINYEKLRTATLLIRKGVKFIGTNPDRTYPLPEGLVPGAGSILAALEAASGTQPKTIGKPAPDMYLIALERLGTRPEETLVIGDRLETDIAGAQVIGCLTGLVLSGVTNFEMAMDWDPSPDIIAKDLMSLLNGKTESRQ